MMEPKQRNTAVCFFWTVMLLFFSACGYTIYQQILLRDNPPTQFKINDAAWIIPDFTICPSAFSTFFIAERSCTAVSTYGDEYKCSAKNFHVESNVAYSQVFLSPSPLLPLPLTYTHLSPSLSCSD